MSNEYDRRNDGGRRQSGRARRSAPPYVPEPEQPRASDGARARASNVTRGRENHNTRRRTLTDMLFQTLTPVRIQTEAERSGTGTKAANPDDFVRLSQNGTVRQKRKHKSNNSATRTHADNPRATEPAQRPRREQYRSTTDSIRQNHTETSRRVAEVDTAFLHAFDNLHIQSRCQDREAFRPEDVFEETALHQRALAMMNRSDSFRYFMLEMGKLVRAALAQFNGGYESEASSVTSYMSDEDPENTQDDRHPPPPPRAENYGRNPAREARHSRETSQERRRRPRQAHGRQDRGPRVEIVNDAEPEYTGQPLYAE